MVWCYAYLFQTLNYFSLEKVGSRSLAVHKTFTWANAFTSLMLFLLQAGSIQIVYVWALEKTNILICHLSRRELTPYIACRNWDVLSTQGHTQSGVVQISWAGLQPNGAIVNFGSVVNSATSDLMSFTPTAVVVNGINCAIVPAPSLPS